MVYLLYMNKILIRRLASIFVLSIAGVAIFAFFGIDPRSSPAVQQLSETCYQIYLNGLEIYRNNPTIGAFLIAAAIGIPAGLALSMVWPRNGLFSLFEGRHAPVQDPRA
jgi:uncharacterized membrane protein YjjB (DUF3815 family)